ncbi:hypothetical protein ACWIG5_28740 [Streptomyces lydicus]
MYVISRELRAVRRELPRHVVDRYGPMTERIDTRRFGQEQQVHVTDLPLRNSPAIRSSLTP